MEAPTHVDLFAVQPWASLDDASLEAFTTQHHALALRVDALRARDERERPLHPALVAWLEVVGAPLGVMGHVHGIRHCTT